MVEEPARGRGAVSKWFFHAPPPPVSPGLGSGNGLETGDKFVAEGGLVLDVPLDRFHERIVLKGTPHLFKVNLLLFPVTVGTETGAGGHGEFFFGIFIKQPVKGDNGIFPSIDNADDVGGGDRVQADAVPTLHDFPCPGPFQMVVVCMEMAERVVYLAGGGDFTGFDTGDEFGDFTLGGDKSGEVHPFAFALVCVGA